MNRRGFISMLAGAAGALVVPWRADTSPRIFLPPLSGWPNQQYTAKGNMLVRRLLEAMHTYEKSVGCWPSSVVLPPAGWAMVSDAVAAGSPYGANIALSSIEEPHFMLGGIPVVIQKPLVFRGTDLEFDFGYVAGGDPKAPGEANVIVPVDVTTHDCYLMPP